MMQLFIADVHLPPEAQHPLSQAFLSFLTGRARELSHLYILGDLFDGWLGDDMGLTQYAPVITALADYQAAGHELWIGHGNRDFLLKAAFFAAVQAHPLPEEQEILLGEERAVILHGDSLCLDDLAYQAFRRQALTPSWQAQVLSLSPQERLALLAKIKDQSRDEMTHKSSAMMDVTADALTQLWQRHPLCRHIIHGHTHQPAHHQDAQGRSRWVLGDWRPEAIGLYYAADRGLFLDSVV